ncbi:MAG: hypothetical protein O7A63_00075 [Acidobacteria bacterium]|nr:hypothetical protein [Acidobacteriota bacterium]
MKYRQPGYRDSEYKEERERKREKDRGPRGPRGAPREASLVRRCFQCGHQEPASVGVEQGMVCPGCSEPSHSCRNCAHFDPGARWECRQPIQVRIESKIAANDCSSFKPETVLDATGRRIATPGSGSGGKVRAPRDAFDALFKK